jgi:hypothetical protein
VEVAGIDKHECVHRHRGRRRRTWRVAGPSLTRFAAA